MDLLKNVVSYCFPYCAHPGRLGPLWVSLDPGGRSIFFYEKLKEKTLSLTPLTSVIGYV